MATRIGTTFLLSPKDPAATAPFVAPNGALVAAKERRTKEIFTTAGEVATDKLFLGTIPRGGSFAAIELTTDTTLGSSTLAIGTLASAALFAAAATLTATDTPTRRGKASAKALPPMTEDTDVYATVAAATLPTGAVLVSELCFTTVT